MVEGAEYGCSSLKEIPSQENYQPSGSPALQTFSLKKETQTLCVTVSACGLMEEGPLCLITVLCLWICMLGGGGGHEESILRLMESFSFPLIDSVDPEVSFLKWENLSPCPPHSVFLLP